MMPSLSNPGQSANRLRLCLHIAGLLLLPVSIGMTILRVGESFSRGLYPAWHSFYSAAEALRLGNDPLAASDNWYIYPPLFAWLLSPLTHLQRFESAWAFFAISIAATLAACLVISRLIADRFSLNKSHTMLPLSIGLAWLAHSRFAYWEFQQSQTDWLILVCFVGAIAWMDRRPLLCGLALGFAANIKYLSLIALPYLLIRRRFAAAAWTVAGCLVFAILPSVFIGWETNQRMLSSSLQRLSLIARNDAELGRDDGFSGMFPITWDRSVSIPSCASRIARDTGLGSSGTLAIMALISASAAALAWTFYRRNSVPLLLGRSPRNDLADPTGMMPGVLLLEWLGVMLICIDFGPQMTPRHTFLLLPLTLLSVVLALHPRQGAPCWRAAIAAVLPIGSAMLAAAYRSESSPRAWPNYMSMIGWAWLAAYLLLLYHGIRYLSVARANSAPRVATRPAGFD